MDLLSSPKVTEVLGAITRDFGPQTVAGPGGLNDFFWLNAARKTGAEAPLSIWPHHPSAQHEDGATPPARLCNLILQGGGTLGLAHAGFVTGLEAAGVRCVGLAGTSAGSILAMGIAAIRGDDVLRPVARRLVEISDAVPMDSFIDGPRPVRVLIKRALKGHPLLLPHRWPGLVACLLRLRDRRGLNHGTAFEHWLESVMVEEGCHTIDRLYAHLDRIWRDLSDLRALTPPGHGSDPVLKDPAQDDSAFEGRSGAALLQLISMAMPVGLKLKLPQDLYYLHADYQNTSPARLVRTSMSIPAFFEPVVMRTNRATWPKRVQAEVAALVSAAEGRQFEALEDLTFLDGGMMSNLPSDSFREVMPQVPSIVVPLVRGGSERTVTRRHSLAGLARDSAACAAAVRLQRDRETWAQNTVLQSRFDQTEAADPDVVAGTRRRRRYPVAIAAIDTGDANWLNFTMSAQEKAALFEAGLIRAHDLLESLHQGGPT